MHTLNIKLMIFGRLVPKWTREEGLKYKYERCIIL